MFASLLVSLVARRDAYIGVPIPSAADLDTFFRLATACTYLLGRQTGAHGYAAAFPAG